ncbi:MULTISPECIES: hypothetical protein [unclassified Lentimonas]|uniref:hypothetical protein n=1 Tax=unclassified Lentimonas TaxID=2630993 RepID=UPI00132BE7C4|nr:MULTISPECIES: hypothetical protein [unclassified Lentimonas]CAA6676765.1 Unannotated [Lentimonas sp. CC4]CAA6684570.1 Unannotated [Lentimonas sp. CC6]CAA7075206.1 Unannotated [Lentimonas sp. CC4]CAA7170591.1 Unannotated [Lentimonas sp. CC21]CAA7183201.1 Unannotated [Lentimonas sp. CC8]
MSVTSRKVFFVILTCLCVTCAIGQAEQWMRGSAVVTSVRGEPRLEEVGGEMLQLSSEDSQPRHVLGLFQVRTAVGESVFLQTSNRISIYNQGSGYFAIERFEQDIATSEDAGKSRMILNLRQGLVAVDNRALSDNSQMIVETPVGRISVKNGWWLMEIVYDERSHIYDFSIECADGVLRFTNLKGDTYTLRNGQRLRGAGASGRPSIEVAEVSEEASELFEDFAAMEAAVTELDISAGAFRANMKPMQRADSGADALAEVAEARGTKRPLLIEYAPQSAPVTPSRAVIQSPSSYEADLF